VSILTLRTFGLVLWTGIVLAGCAGSAQRKPDPPPTVPAKPPVKTVPHTPLDKKAAELGETTWSPQWTGIIERAVPPALLSRHVPRDVRHFCPRFYEMSDRDKRAFWAYFFQALAGAEAGLNPGATVRHTEPKMARLEHVPVSRVRTEGLLQLTYDDEHRYGCPFNERADRGLKPGDPARTILQPKNNLVCGVMILKNQLIDQHKPIVTATSYWATLRPGLPGYRNFLRQMTNPPAVCGLHRRPRHGSRSGTEIAP